MTAVIPGRTKNQFNLRLAGAPPGGLDVQDVRAHGRGRRGHRPGHDLLPLGAVPLPARSERRLRDGSWWCVETYEPHATTAATSVARATLRSDNTVYAQLTLDVGARATSRTMAQAARRARPSSRRGAVVPSIGLGSIAVSPLDMASAYATLAAGGVYSRADGDPQGRAPERQGRRRAPAGAKPKRKRVISDGVAYEVTEILEQNVQYGTGTGAYFGRPAAGKTGTTDDHADAWFCGYTPAAADGGLDGLSAGRDPDGERARDLGRRRHLPRRDLAALHGAARIGAPRCRRLAGAAASCRSGTSFEPGQYARSATPRTTTTTTPPTTRRPTPEPETDGRPRPRRRAEPPPTPPPRDAAAATAASDPEPPPPPPPPPSRRRPTEPVRPERPAAASSRLRRSRSPRRRLRRRRLAGGSPLVPARRRLVPTGDERWVAASSSARRGAFAATRGCWLSCSRDAAPRPARRRRARGRRSSSLPLAAPLLLSTDAWTYWDYGRIAAVHGGNPYRDPPAEFPDEPGLPVRRRGLARHDLGLRPGVHARLRAARARRAGRRPTRRPGSTRRSRRSRARGRCARGAARARGRASRSRSSAGTRCSRSTSRAAGTTTPGSRALVLGALALARRGPAAARRAAWALAILVKWVPLVFLAAARARGARDRPPGRRTSASRAAALVVALATLALRLGTGSARSDRSPRNAAPRRASRSRTGSSSSASRTRLALGALRARFVVALRLARARGAARARSARRSPRPAAARRRRTSRRGTSAWAVPLAAAEEDRSWRSSLASPSARTCCRRRFRSDRANCVGSTSTPSSLEDDRQRGIAPEPAESRAAVAAGREAVAVARARRRRRRPRSRRRASGS